MCIAMLYAFLFFVNAVAADCQNEGEIEAVGDRAGKGAGEGLSATAES